MCENYWRPHEMLKTLEGIVLIGWMEKDAAVSFLRSLCHFDGGVTDAEAEALWLPYRERVLALPERAAVAPVVRKVDGYHESKVVAEFQKRFRRAANILDVIKIDPMGLVVHQLQVVTERANNYRKVTGSVSDWMKTAILCDGPPPNLPMRTGVNAIDVVIPDAEYVFVFDPSNGFGIQKLARHVNVTRFGQRMLLWAGYHRSYARMVSMAPEAIDRSLIVALTTDGAFKVSQDSPNHGEREMLTGPRPPLFGDFFDGAFFMPVKLLKKRYELSIRAQLVAIDDES
jgi:hypothetical protein